MPIVDEPVARISPETVTVAPAAIRISAHGSTVSVPVTFVSEVIKCGLAAAVHVSSPTFPTCVVGPPVGATHALVVVPGFPLDPCAAVPDELEEQPAT